MKLKSPLYYSQNDIFGGIWNYSLELQTVLLLKFCYSCYCFIPGSSMPEARHSMTRRRASPAPRGLLHVAMAFSHINSKGWEQKSTSLFRDGFITLKKRSVHQNFTYGTLKWEITSVVTVKSFNLILQIQDTNRIDTVLEAEWPIHYFLKMMKQLNCFHPW